ncbi:HlyD family type I secretion periplasmic adaptor subunit [Aestuariibacter sp. AA17]|uniref:Membrane fusion protein (MFP) family protein n=1 Tax=Fluctibacter corallii TaxID=2984329 RepID=A0ABT3A770_9ALTE|nr:HlyD family type I secretion periplasmic adaptor subunit [Aestuariibacter sp. AA17]MCV2884534.1 HlyD family type I secretion periplasmic adaptor subunit [Aestuariibacter sp. AA17]
MSTSDEKKQKAHGEPDDTLAGENVTFAKVDAAINRKSGMSFYIGKKLTKLLQPPPSHDWVLESEWARVQQDPLKARLLMWFVCLSMAVLIVWASVFSIAEVTRGDGKVIPSQKLQVIQSYDGGVVEDIYVSDGQKVAKDDVLLRIDPTRYMSDLNEKRSKLLAVKLLITRLRALTLGVEFKFDDTLAKEAGNLLSTERALYQSSIDEYNELTEGLSNLIEQRVHELEEAKATLNEFEETLTLTEQELALTKPLLRSGAVSEIDILKLEKDIVSLKGKIEKNQSMVKKQASAIKESENKLKEAQLRMKNRWSSQLAEAQAELDTLVKSEEGLADVVNQTEIRSPVDGTIQRVLVNTIGGVVQPGNAVIEIIPSDDALIVEAKISPRDIAFIRPGMPAIVKFTAYDFSIYGGVDATVSHISADSIEEEELVYYLVKLEMAQGFQKANLPVLPGMIAQVDIITGERTIMQYILKPVLKAAGQALSER